MRLKRAVFLDRDGTLNQDAGYTHRISDWIWLPGALAGLKRLREAGWLLVVVSNQSGIGRGYYVWQDLRKLEAWLNDQLAGMGLDIAGWYYCPHLPEAGCDCRKPAPGMLLKAAAELEIDLAASWMLGDKLSDIQAGLAAGCSCGLIASCGNGADIEGARTIYPAVPVWPSLAAAAEAIIAASSGQSARNFA